MLSHSERRSSKKGGDPQPLPASNGARMGYRLSDFHFIRTLGTGTFGRVYLSKYRDSDQYYAMKMLNKADLVRMQQLEHVACEKQILHEINFPFIVNLVCTFQDDRHLFMLMEYVVGGELFSHLRRAGKFSNDMARFYAAEIVLAIEYLHDRDIVYRDLKPENLLLDHHGHIKITDFGFAKKVIDRTWTCCGTPEYLAPEIIETKGHGKAVDWWALGVLIFEMLAGYPPFYDEDVLRLYEKILDGKIFFPPHFDVAARDIVKRLCTEDRSKRLGNLKGGSMDIKKHRWFRGVDWTLLLEKKVGRAPIVPVVTHAGDARNFDEYQELSPESFGSWASGGGGGGGSGGRDAFQGLFTDF